MLRRLLPIVLLALACDRKDPASEPAPASKPAPVEQAKATPPAPTTPEPPTPAKPPTRNLDDEGYNPEKPAGPAPKISSGWEEIDQGDIDFANTPAISTDGKTIIHRHGGYKPGELDKLLVYRSRSGKELEVVTILTEEEIVAAGTVPKLEKFVKPRIDAANAALAKRGWIPLLGGEITPDDRAKSGLETTLTGNDLTIKRGDKVLFAGEVGKFQPCEEPYVHGLYRDPDTRLAYVILSHSLDKCQPQKPTEHLILPLDG